MVSIKALLQVTPPTVPITTFSPGFFVVLQEILCQPFVYSDQIKDQCIFKVKQIISLKSLLIGFDFAVLFICACCGIFSQFCHYETTNQ